MFKFRNHKYWCYGIDIWFINFKKLIQMSCNKRKVSSKQYP